MAMQAVEEPVPQGQERLKQVVKWVYTKWDEGKDLFPAEMCKYRVEGREIAPDTGRVHWQCFAILRNKQRFTEIQARDVQLGGTPSYFRPAKAEPWKAAAYCKKGAQTHAEWDTQGVEGPNYGRDADFTEVGEAPKVPGEKGLVKKVRCESLSSPSELGLTVSQTSYPLGIRESVGARGTVCRGLQYHQDSRPDALADSRRGN